MSDQHASSGARTEDTAAALCHTVEEVVAELHPGRGRPAVTLDSRLDRDLGLDSLGRVELAARVERRFGVTLAERAFTDAGTPRDLLRALGQASAARRPAEATAPAAEPTPEAAEGPPEQAGTLVEVLAWHTRAHAERPHVRIYGDTGEGEVISYGRLAERARAMAAGLQARGIAAGEPVALMLPTGAEYFYSFFGVLLAGAVPVPLYPPARLSHIEDHLRRQHAVLANCRTALLVTDEEVLRYAHLVKAHVETLRETLTPAALAADPGAYRAPGIGPADTAFLQYTSGSTGDPKGVVLSHANLLANIRAMGRAIDAGSHDVFVSWLPLYHDMGLIGAWLGSLYYAAPLMVMSPLAFVARPQRWLWALHRHGGTLSAAPNFGYELCLRRLTDEDLEGLDLSRWRVAFNGAEPVSPATLERFCERFAPYGFRREVVAPVYGLAEGSVGLTFPPLGRGPVIDRVQRETLMRTGHAAPTAEDDPSALTFVGCGRPLPGHEVRITDPTGLELPERQEGRIEFRGPSATSGYYRNPEATRALFDDGWLNTGDRGYIASGELYVTGRDKDIVIRAGRNIYPQELEDTVGDLDGIRKGNVAVFASPDPVSGTERLIVLAETRRRGAEAQQAL
nr:AMP-binding protein [Gammaproteobacteria bacterium]